MMQYDQISVDYMHPSISDHSPLLIQFGEDHKKGGRPFKFFNFKADHSKFEQVMAADWHKPEGHPT